MKVRLLDKLDLISYNKKLHYNLAEAEKDYMIAIVLRILFNSALKDRLVFKGGTAIHHSYLPQLRFSEDIDFTNVGEKIELEEIRNILLPYKFLEIKKEYLSKNTLKIERLKYIGPLQQGNSIKIEIDQTQNVLCESKYLRYSNVWNIDFKVRVMDEKEICAEKIRAMSERSRYRDFYDLYWLFKHYHINQKEILEIISKKEIRETIKKEYIIKNFERAIHELSIKKTNISYRREVEQAEIEKLIESLDFVVITKSKI